MVSKPEYRIIDANGNRAREGLRVVEEYARYVMNSTQLCARIKGIRHDFAEAFNNLTRNEPVLSARDTPGDVGTTVSTATESTRKDPEAVAKASIRRLEESLRVIEEYSKIFAPAGAGSFEALRYRVYELEAMIFSAQDRHTRLKGARLYVIITDSLASSDAVTTARECAAGGADIIQLREKEIEDGAFLRIAEEMNAICREAGTLFIINDRPHIATLIDADGIHTGQGDLPVNLARRIVGRDRIIGRSTSAPEVLARAAKDGADYAGVGPVYETNTKQHRAAAGLGYVQHAAEFSTIPYFAIGSVNRETLPAVMAAGARSVAVCTAIIGARDIAAETAWFKKQLESAS